jgi:hypothetical protein
MDQAEADEQSHSAISPCHHAALSTMTMVVARDGGGCMREKYFARNARSRLAG